MMIMTKFQHISMVATVFAAMLLPSCSNEADEPQASSCSELEEVKFRSGNTAVSRHTDDGFVDGDEIEVFAVRPGTLTLPKGVKYRYEDGLFSAAPGYDPIMKAKGERMRYFAINKYRSISDGDFELEGGDFDYLCTEQESYESAVNLTFAHVGAKLQLVVRIEAVTILPTRVRLLGVINTYWIEPFNIDFIYMEDRQTDVVMERENIDTDNDRYWYITYTYYIPPVNEVGVNDAFIEIWEGLGSSKKYLFAPPSDVEFEPNHLYVWEADLINATPSDSQSRSGGCLNRATLVKDEELSDAPKNFNINTSKIPK